MKKTIQKNFKYILAGIFLSFVFVYSIYGTQYSNHLNTEIFSSSDIKPVININR